jgi:sigma-70-like protein
MTHQQIASQLALPPGTVKGRLRLGLQKLRKEGWLTGFEPATAWTTTRSSTS